MSVELEHDFTFNPDGSGRVAVRWSGPTGRGAPEPGEFLRSELERAQGVEAWADVRCEVEGDRLVFAGTAWFPDVTALRFHCQGFHVNLLDLAVTAHDDGSVEVTTRPSGAPRSPAPPPGADLGRLMAQEREKLAMARGFLDGMFGGLRCSAVLRLPGALTGPVRGERVADDAARVSFDGAQLIAILDRLATDDDLFGRLLANGGLEGPDALFELLGEHGPIALRTAPGAAPAFDYASEVAAAREQFAAFAAAGQIAAPSTEPATPLAGVRIVAAKVVREADGDRELCPQGQNQPGVTLTVAADLPQRALELEDAGYDRCVFADGRDVTADDEWNRRCHFPKQTSDGRTVYLDFELPATDGARGLAELTGHLKVLASEGSERHDLGFTELTPGAKGTFAEARVNAIEQEDERTWRFEIHLHLARTSLLELALVCGDETTPLQQTGYSCCNDESDLTYRHDGDLPRDARLVATVVAGLSRTRYAFTLQQVDWFGEPL